MASFGRKTMNQRKGLAPLAETGSGLGRCLLARSAIRPMRPTYRRTRQKEVILANELKVEQVDMLPCPFCGGGAVLRYVRDGKETFCKGCGACGPSAFHGPNRDTEERAVSAWNHRIASEKPRTPVSVGESENIRVKIGELVDCAVRGDNPVIIANQIAWWFRQLEAVMAERE